MSFDLTGEPAADRVLDEYPLALLIGMMLDQQYPMEHAFRGAWKVLERFGSLDPNAIATADPAEFAAVCSVPPAIHRYPKAMASRMQELAAIVRDTYDSDASKLWAEATTGKELNARVQALPGFGKQKSKIFVAFLAKQIDVRPPGWEQIAGDYALAGYRSIADVTSAEALRKVRAHKQELKAAAKAAANES